MPTANQLANERLAQAIIERREWNGRRFELGTFVAIADGRVIGVAASFDAADAQLAQAGAKLGEGMICEVVDSAIDVVRCETLPCR